MMSNLKETAEGQVHTSDNQAQWEQLDELLGTPSVKPSHGTNGHVCCGRHGHGGCGCGGLHHSAKEEIK